MQHLLVNFPGFRSMFWFAATCLFFMGSFQTTFWKVVISVTHLTVFKEQL